MTNLLLLEKRLLGIPGVGPKTVAALKHNPYLRSLYHRKISEGKESKQALVCVGKKILSIMYSMLKYEADYDPQRIFFQFEKERILT